MMCDSGVRGRVIIEKPIDMIEPSAVACRFLLFDQVLDMAFAEHAGTVGCCYWSRTMLLIHELGQAL